MKESKTEMTACVNWIELFSLCIFCVSITTNHYLTRSRMDQHLSHWLSADVVFIVHSVTGGILCLSLCLLVVCIMTISTRSRMDEHPSYWVPGDVVFIMHCVAGDISCLSVCAFFFVYHHQSVDVMLFKVYRGRRPIRDQTNRARSRVDEHLSYWLPHDVFIVHCVTGGISCLSLCVCCCWCIQL